MKKTVQKTVKGILIFVLSLSLLPINLLGYAAETEEAEEIAEEIVQDIQEEITQDIQEATPSWGVELDISQGSIDGDGNTLLVTARVTYSEGTVPADGNYVVYVYVGTGKNYEKLQGKSEITFNPFNISGGKNYDVYAVIKDGDEIIAESSHRTITVIKQTIAKSDITVGSAYEGEGSGTITVNTAGVTRLKYYKEQSNDRAEVEGNVITGLYEGTYYVYTPAYSDGDTYYIASSRQKAVVGKQAKPRYLITTNPADDLTWSKKEVDIVINGSTSVYVKPSDDDHYISRVYAVPEENAKVEWYEPTGEVYISGITGNIKLYAEATLKNAPANIEVVSVSFNENGIYSEENPYILTEIEVKITDKDKNPVPETEVYYKTDESDRAYFTRKTDENGIAVFKNSYGIAVAKGDITASYNALFSTDKEFKKLTTSTTINLVLRQKKDLELYTYQITGSRPEVHEGKVTGVPDDYEIWTGEVHDGAIVMYSGTWARPVNGEFTGLSVGLNLLRFGEKVDEETNTFWFASDYDLFEVPRINNASTVAGDKPDTPAEEPGTDPGTNPETDSGTNPGTAPASEPSTSGEPSNETPDNTSANTLVVTNAGQAVTQTTVPGTVSGTLRPAAPADAETEQEPPEDTGEDETPAASEPEEAPTVAETQEEQPAVEIADEDVALAAAPVEDNGLPNYLYIVILAALLLVLAAGTYAYYRVKRNKQ